MKKRIALVVVLVALMAAPAFSIGIGAAFNTGFGLGLPNSAMLSVKLDEFPAVFGIGASIGFNEFQIGVTADWWLYRADLISIFALYIGPGIYAQIGNSFGLGVRVPIGIQAFVLDPLELFLEIAPALGLGLYGGDIEIPVFRLQGAFGFRFWF